MSDKIVKRNVQYRYLDTTKSGANSQTLMHSIRKALKSQRNGDIVGKAVRARIADLDQSGQLTVLNDMDGTDDNDSAFLGPTHSLSTRY